MPEVVEEVVEAVKEVVEQLQEAAVNATARPQATPEGMAIAYGSLVVMALVPIYFGAFRSVKRQAENKVTKCQRCLIPIEDDGSEIICSRSSRSRRRLCQDSGEKTEKIMAKDAAMFPLFASAALFGLYLVFRVRNERK